MKMLRCVAAVVLTIVLAASPLLAQSQDEAVLWRTFAEKVDVGTPIKVRLRDGRRFSATLIEAQPDALLLQRKTRLPVPVEPIGYDTIVSIERDKGGMSAGRAAAIGVGTGVATFFGILFILIASIDD